MKPVTAAMASVVMLATPAAAQSTCVEEAEQVRAAIHAGDLSEASKDQADGMLYEARRAGEHGDENSCRGELENVRIIFGVGASQSAVPDPGGLEQEK